MQLSEDGAISCAIVSINPQQCRLWRRGAKPRRNTECVCTLQPHLPPSFLTTSPHPRTLASPVLATSPCARTLTHTHARHAAYLSAMAIHPPLLLLATALGVASRGEAAPPAAQWVVLPAGSPAGQAASHGEFGPFTLATTPASAALPAAAAAAAGVSRWQHEPASRVWVVRLGQHVVDGGNLRDALTDAQAALTLRHEGRAGWLVVEATADLPVGKGIDAAVPRSWRPLLESLSVPPTPVRPAASRDGPPSSVARWLAPGILKALPVRRGNRSGHAAATPRVAADPGIVAALAEVQEENLRTTVEHLADNYHTRLSTSEGARGAEEWIKREFTRMGLEVHEFEFNSSMSKVVTATRAGTVDPSRLVVIGAHYDSRAADMEEDERAPGADDNGSGTAMVLELARVAAALRMDTAYSLHFCAFSGEEQGLLGSRAYANHLAEKYGPNKVVASE